MDKEELREQIAETLYNRFGKLRTPELHEWSDASEITKKYYRQAATPVVALLPDVRREERERIANIIKEYRLDSASVRDDMLELKAMGWELLEQALKPIDS